MPRRHGLKSYPMRSTKTSMRLKASTTERQTPTSTTSVSNREQAQRVLKGIHHATPEGFSQDLSLNALEPEELIKRLGFVLPDQGLKLIHEPSPAKASDVGDKLHTDSGTIDLVVLRQVGSVGISILGPKVCVFPRLLGTAARSLILRTRCSVFRGICYSLSEAQGPPALEWHREAVLPVVLFQARACKGSVESGLVETFSSSTCY